MNQDQFKQWVKEVPTLSIAQLNELSARITLLNKTAATTHSGKGDFAVRALESICDTMRKNNIETPSVSTLKRSTAFTQSKQKLEDLAVYFETISKSKLVQNSILRIALSLLYNDLVQWKGVAISSHTMLRQIHRIPSTLNRSFPGYAAAGLLTKLVKGSNVRAQ